MRFCVCCFFIYQTGFCLAQELPKTTCTFDLPQVVHGAFYVETQKKQGWIDTKVLTPSVTIRLRDQRLTFKAAEETSDADFLFVCKVVELKKVRLGVTQITSNGLRDLYKLSKLEYFQMSGKSVNDDAMNSICKLSRLQSLQLWNTTITNNGLACVARLKNLEALTIGFNQEIDDEGIKCLLELQHLRVLRLVSLQLTNASLQYLGQINGLHDLDLSGTKISGIGFKNFLYPENIEAINLSLTAITNSGLDQLTHFTTLKRLNLRSTGISEESIPCLIQLQSLEELNIINTQIRYQESLQVLRDNLPKLWKLQVYN